MGTLDFVTGDYLETFEKSSEIWRAQGGDLRAFLGDFVASLTQIEIAGWTAFAVV